jgi:enamine deaminase RidA (YjgF/YER057c/UK114 family)
MGAGAFAGGLAFFSSVIGADQTGRPVTSLAALAPPASEFINDGADNVYALQAAGAVGALQQNIQAAGRNLNDITHLTVCLEDIEEFPRVERVLLEALGTWRPALTLLEVPSVAPVRGARVSISAVGWFA